MLFRSAVAVVVFSVVCGSAYSQVVWSDEFAGDTIDPGVWTYDVGGWGFGNGQLEYNTERKENSYVDNGKLVIEARRERYKGNAFTSARMLTQGRFAFMYGSLEARIKLPDTADGLWPAFWMLGDNFGAINWPRCGEVDILEAGGKEGIAKGLQHRRINCALHYAGAGQRKQSDVAWHNAGADLNEGYHLYRLDWTPEYMKFYLDGNQFGSFDITGPDKREFHQPHFLILNLAVGSWDSSYTGIPRPDGITAKLPAKMYVDWIRLSANEHTKVYRGADAVQVNRFGVYTESTAVEKSLAYGNSSNAEFAYGDKAAVFVWNNMKPVKGTASEGKACWSYDVAADNWFGMGVMVPSYLNMKNYSNGYLHFDIKAKTAAAMKVGIKSSRGGESFLPLGDEKAEFGFARDGNWHTVKVPLSEFENIDFHTVHQLFMISGAAPADEFNLSIDNVYWETSGK